MPFDAFVLHAVADEINEKIVESGRRVQKIFQIKQELIITFRGEGGPLSLYLSVHPQNFRIHFTGRHYVNPLSPPGFLYAPAQAPNEWGPNIS
jgi:predicted ribosome quality control (RQC) complex YloA/Tae2 family protein